MWTSDSYRNQIAILDLVASDAAYWTGGFGEGSLLRTSPDNDPLEDYPFRTSILERIGEADDPLSILAYEPRAFPGADGNPIEGVEFKNWRQEGPSIQLPASGVGAVVYRRIFTEGGKEKNEYIVAFRGTDGRNGQDWFANIQLAKNQWRDVFNQLFGAGGRLQGFVNEDGTPSRIHFTGQSLGGGLAQYAAYEYVRQRETNGTTLFRADFEEKRAELVSLTTFNAFAGGLGLKQLYDGNENEDFDPLRLAGVPTAHYSIENDIVHNIGGSFVGNELQYGFLNATDAGQSNLYHFSNWRHWDTDAPTGSVGIERRDPQGYLGLVEGHRIESGFYQGLDRYGTTFSSAIQGGDPIGQVKLDSLQAVGEIFARFLGSDRSEEIASWARITAGVCMGAIFASVGDVARLLRLGGNALYKSDKINGLTRTLVASQVGSYFSASAVKLLAKPTIAIAGASSLVAAIADLFGSAANSQQVTDLINRNITNDKQFQIVTVADANDGSVVAASDSGRSFALLLDYLQPELVKGTALESHQSTLDTLANDPIGFGAILYGSDDGYQYALTRLANDAHERVFTDDNARTLDFAADLGIFGAIEGNRVSLDNTARIALGNEVGNYLEDLTAALINLSPDLVPSLRKTSDVVLAPIANDASYRQLIDQLGVDLKGYRTSSIFGLSATTAPELDEQLSEARAALIEAGSTVSLRAGTGANRYNSASFDSNGTLQKTVTEGGAQFFTADLPYAAPVGGRTIRMKVAGNAVETLNVVRGSDTVTLDGSGEFDLFVHEGVRQVAFAVVQARPIDSDSALTLSATLIDNEGSPTHQTHLEATFSLEAFDEPSDPVTTNEMVRQSGDGALYFDTPEPDHIVLLDALDAVNTYLNYDAVAYVENRFAGVARGSSDWVSTHSGRDVIYTGTGNDLIETGTGGMVGPDAGGDWAHAGAGDDRIYGNEVVDTDAAIAEGEAGEASVERGDALAGGVGDDLAIGTADQDFLSGGGGADVLVGGAGNDYLLGDTDFETRLFDWTVAVDGAGTDNRSYAFFGFREVEVLPDPHGDRLYGGAGDDVAFGEEGDDFIDLGTGSDHGIGGDGEDVVLGGAGEDLLVGEDDGDFLDGGEDADRLFGAEGSDVLYGGGGDDFLQGDSDDAGAGEDYLDGEDGNDFLVAGGLSDVLYGGAGDDQLHGDGENVDLSLQGADELFGEDGDDRLIGYRGDDILDGGEGADILTGGWGMDELSGGAGNDLLSGDEDEEGGDADFIEGGAGDDSIEAQGGDDVVFGDEGNDAVGGGTGADYLDAGEGDDFVGGGAGDDELIGGSGNDSLTGDAGADVYRYALGDGVDRIRDGGDLGAGVDTLSFGAGISFADVSLSRGWSGELAIRLADGGEVTIDGMFSDPWDQIERITFEDGTVVTPEDLDSLPTGVMVGTDGDDTLVGSENIDTLLAGAGDDTLDGGRGDDVLEGGAGVDTYSVGFTSGHDTIVEGAGETSVIVLTGLNLEDLRAARSGDDLTLTVRGTGNGVTVQDYFTAAQEISVLDAAGTSLGAAQLLEISENEQVTRETLKADFRVGAKVDFFARHLAEGYQFVDANTAARTSTAPVVVGVDRTEVFDFVTVIYFDGRPQEFFTTYDERIELRALGPGAVLHESLQYVHRLTESDEPFIFPEAQEGVAESFSTQLVALDWEEHPEVLLNHAQSFLSHAVIDPEAPEPVAIGTAHVQHNEYLFSHVAIGWIVATPGDHPAYLPVSEIVDRTDVTVTRAINEVLAGPGDNTIWGAYIADGGAGNDSISGDGLLLGGEGDDTLSGTGALYGEDGNDSISGTGYLDGGHGDDWISAQGFEGSVIAPGSGNDTVVGGGRKDIVRIGPDDTGTKLLWDYGSVADYAGESGIPFFDRHYRALGIPNWRNVPRSLLPKVSANDFQLLAPMFDFEFYPTDIVELPSTATLGNLEVAWGFYDLDDVHRTLDLSWGTQTLVRIVLPNASESTPEEFADLVGNGFERVRLGGGVELRIDQLLALAPATLPPRQVIGTELDDSLLGWEGADELQGLAGNDQLQGNGGDDHYRYFAGDGIDGISDTGGADAVVFGEGIAPQDVLVTRDPYGTVYVEVGNPQDRLELYNWFTSDGQIERVEFANGTAWDAAEIESRIATAPATEFGDILNAGDGDDMIDGLAGDDLVYGNGGNDILAGGEGSDYLEGSGGNNLLQGGAGDDNLGAGTEPGHHLFIGGTGNDFIATGAAGDVVAFNAGDGNDTILAVDALTLSLGGGIGAADLSLTYDDFGLALNVAGGDSIQLWTQPQITLQLFGSVHTYDLSAAINEFYAQWNGEPGVVFALADVLPAYQTGSSETDALGGAIAWQYATAGNTDGLTSAQLRSVLADPGFGVAAQPIVVEGETNNAPVAGTIADRSADEDAVVSFSVAEAFSDPDAGDALTYAASTVDGGSLPAWLSFDESSAAFSGTPDNADVGSIGIRVTAIDGAGLSAQADFDLTVLNVNDAPTLAHAIGEHSFAAGTAFTFAVPADTFADADANDTLSLSARLAGGGALPAWLTFDPPTGLFRGSPQVSNLGVLHLEVTATDAAGEATVDDFGLVVRAPDGATVNGRKGDDVIHGGSGNETLIAKGGSDYVYGDAGDDVLRGGAGNDVLQGGEGSDELRSGSGQNVLDGGAGADVLHGGQGSAFLAGGAGNDEIRVGRGSDVIAFNAGDGIDTLFGGRDGGNTLSFGGGIGYDDLSFSKSGHDLVLNAGANDRMVLKNWYRGNHSVENLQVILDATDEYDPMSEDALYNKRVQIFDMWSLVAKFNQALATDPHLDSWSIMNGIAGAPAQVASSNDSAIGGDLAYWYGRNRTLAGISLAAAQEILGAPGFGADAQSLRPFDGLQEGFVRLR